MSVPDGDSPAELAGLSEAQRNQVMRRWSVLRPHLEDDVALSEAAAQARVPPRTAQRWLANYRADGLAGLARRCRADAGHRSLPQQQVALIEGLALRRPALSTATIHRHVLDLAGEYGWPRPSYSTVYSIITGLDPAMMTLAHEGTKRYEEVYELVYRRQAAGPNQIWQADHTELDLWVLTPAAKPGPALADRDRGRSLPRRRRLRAQPASTLGD